MTIGYEAQAGRTVNTEFTRPGTTFVPVKLADRPSCVVLAAIGGALVLACFAVGVRVPAGAAQRFPGRDTSPNPDCAAQPARPLAGTSGFAGRRFPIVAGIDANGCDSWPYELASSVGIYRSFFAGSGFDPGQHAYEFGTQETTELIDGHQLIRVVDPTPVWLRVYKGYDACSKTSDPATTPTITCIAPAVESRPDDLVLYIPAAVIVIALLLFVIHYLRPAGPIRRRRHYRSKQRPLVRAVSGPDHSKRGDLDVKQLQRRLRRLEKFVSPELSESQHHWFHGLVASGRQGLALEALTRWLAESHMPVPDHIRQEVLWIASSLRIERQVRPVLDAGVQGQVADASPGEEVAGGFDVPVAEFTQMVADAVDSLPEAFGRAMTNVAVVVEEEAEGRKLFGLYEGHPLTRYRIRQWSVHPDKITIYRRTICEHSRSEQEVRAQVYQTVIHEIAHHFGIDDPRLRELGW
jgi:predicted Zn-dependent protease with MMP-like domain